MDIRLYIGFWDHPKTIALEKRCGLRGGPVALQRLWLHVRVHYPTGDISKAPDEWVRLVARVRKPAEFLVALREIGWLDADGMLHDWDDWQGYSLGTDRRRELARHAARTRWSNARSNADGNAQSMRSAYAERHAPSPSPSGSGSVVDPDSEPRAIPQIESDSRRSRNATRRVSVGLLPGFLRAWKAYPTGQRSKKAASALIWARDQLEQHAENVVDWIEAAKASPDWRRDGGRFIPGMQAWLNGRDFSEPPPHDPLAHLGDSTREAVSALQGWVDRKTKALTE